MDFANLLRGTVGRNGSRRAVSFEGHDQSYIELFERACRLANALCTLGLRTGDRVATLGDNSGESIEIVCGLALAGLVRCPMYVQNPPAVHVYMMNDVGASALIVQDDYYDELAPLLADVPSLRQTLVTGSAKPRALDYTVLLDTHRAIDPNVAIDIDDPYIIRFSAGTTGRSKGIVHSTRGWAAMGSEYQAALPKFDSSDAYLVAAPLSHAAGLLSWPLLSSGARHVVMRRFDAAQFAQLVEHERCTMSLLVPTMIQLVVNHPDAARRDLSSLRAIYYGAAPISERTVTDALALFGTVLFQIYGQSEAPALTVLPASLHAGENGRRYLRSAGRPTPHTELRILDEQDRPLPCGEVGEVCARTPGVMSGIWGNQAATFERFTHDGFLRTRDMGYLDEDGFLFLADRKEDLIISGGFNVWPAEVENALGAHPSVLEAAVVGIPDEKWGETVFAAVRLRDGAKADADELIAWCRERIGSVKKPTRVVFSDEPLPKSGVGKLLRRAVRDKYWQGTTRAIHGA